MKTFKKVKRSFKDAFRGLKAATIETNFRMMILIGLIASFLALYFPLSTVERAIIVFLIGVVLAIELLNSQVERILDLIVPVYDRKAGEIKDISAAAVMVVALTAALIGAIILLPHIIKTLPI